MNSAPSPEGRLDRLILPPLLNPEWQSFQEDFVADVDDNNAKILFDLGGNAISAEFVDVKFDHIGNK